MKHIAYRPVALACGIALAAALAVTGCGSKKYEKIELETLIDSEQSAGNKETAPDEAVPDLISLDGESEVVAGTSTLESNLTMDNGFTDVDETVYVTQNLVNLRMEASTDSRIFVQLNKGDGVKRTGISDGWSRVLYQEQICFVSSEFVTNVDPAAADAGNVQALAAPAAAETDDGAAAVSNGITIAIDAGHQAKGNSEKEPAGPGSTTMKEKVATGTEGVSTGLAEYELTLAVSKRLQRILKERGYQVVMIRESNDVNISNAERAKLANQSGASAFVRVHANSVDSATVSGVLSMCQTEGNPYNGELHGKSYSLSRKVTDGISAATGFKNRGVQETDSMSGINWCEIPVTIVEMGFMSNPKEDELMATEEYQEKIAAGIADGIDSYFGG